MIAHISLFTVLLIGANCFYLNQEFSRPTALAGIHPEKSIKYVQPVYMRERRQVHGDVKTKPNSDGTTNIMARLPLVGNDKNMLSAVGSLQGGKRGGGFKAESAGLVLENVNRHSLSLTGKHITNFGDQLTAAGKFNFVNTNKHDLSANAFAARNLPNNPVMPNFYTYGGGVNYMFNQKVGASLGVKHTPQWQKTDYSVMGKLNLFHDRTSSLDFGAGASKSVSPFSPNRPWQPTFGLSFNKYF